jgi:cell division protein ZapE
MVDVFYDNRVKLIVSAEAPAGQLLRREHANDSRIRAMMFEFERTASRLAEMQTRHYLEQPRCTAE